MPRINPRFGRASIATFALLFAAASAGADPTSPAPPPPPSGPVPAPYPGSEPLPPCPHTFCLPQQLAQDTPAPAPVPSHKHIAGVKYEDLATSSPATLEVNTEEVSWSGPDGPPVVKSADPMEGGQVAARRMGGRPRPQVDGTTVYSADPMEGGQVARSAPTEPGKLEIPNLQGVTEPVAKATAKFKTLAGACVSGKHLDKVLIVTRSRSFTIHDATVTDVTPAGDGMEEVTLSYASREP
jgi:hypothetical protein